MEKNAQLPLNRAARVSPFKLRAAFVDMGRKNPNPFIVFTGAGAMYTIVGLAIVTWSYVQTPAVANHDDILWLIMRGVGATPLAIMAIAFFVSMAGAIFARSESRQKMAVDATAGAWMKDYYGAGGAPIIERSRVWDISGNWMYVPGLILTVFVARLIESSWLCAGIVLLMPLGIVVLDTVSQPRRCSFKYRGVALKQNRPPFWLGESVRIALEPATALRTVSRIRATLRCIEAGNVTTTRWAALPNQGTLSGRYAGTNSRSFRNVTNVACWEKLPPQVVELDAQPLRDNSALNIEIALPPDDERLSTNFSLPSPIYWEVDVEALDSSGAAELVGQYLVPVYSREHELRTNAADGFRAMEERARVAS